MSALCPQCGAPISAGAAKCEYCGAAVAQAAPQAQPQAQPQVVYVQQNTAHPERAAWPVKSKVVAAVLAFLLGGLGVHKFYMGQIGAGVLYLLFCWTYIPCLIAFIEGIMYLCTSDDDFERKYRCRVG